MGFFDLPEVQADDEGDGEVDDDDFEDTRAPAFWITSDPRGESDREPVPTALLFAMGLVFTDPAVPSLLSSAFQYGH